MTPIIDHAFHLRQRLIRDRRSAEQLHYQALIAKGLSEEDAANMSGWHPMVPVDRFLTAFGWWLVALCSATMLMLWVNTSAAVMDARDEVKELAHTEKSFTICLNGGVVKMGDRWFKCECVTMADGTKCPEVWK